MHENSFNKKECKHDSQGTSDSIEEFDESCMGIYPDFKAANKEISWYLLDELSSEMESRKLAGQSTEIIVSGDAEWKRSPDHDSSKREISIAGTDYIFTCYFLDDDDDC